MVWHIAASTGRKRLSVGEKKTQTGGEGKITRWHKTGPVIPAGRCRGEATSDTDGGGLGPLLAASVDFSCGSRPILWPGGGFSVLG